MQKIRSFIKDLLVYTFEKGILKKPASILMYHSVGENKAFFNVRPEDFKWQMNYLKEHNYNVISLRDFVDSKEKGNIPSRTVVITFDDGYEDNFSNAFRVLKDYNFPATIFLTTGRLATNDYMNWAEIKEMHNSGLIDFEPHTVTHPKLSQHKESIVLKEIRDSKQEIENNLSKECHFFAYPYGDYDEENLKVSQSLFKAALTVKRGFVSKSDNMHELKRNSVDSLVGKQRFKLKI